MTLNQLRAEQHMIQSDLLQMVAEDRTNSSEYQITSRCLRELRILIEKIENWGGSCKS